MKTNRFKEIKEWFNSLPKKEWVEVPSSYDNYDNQNLRYLTRHGYSHYVSNSYIYKIKRAEDGLTSSWLAKTVVDSEDEIIHRRDFFKVVGSNEHLYSSMRAYELYILFLHNNEQFTKDEFHGFVLKYSSVDKRTLDIFLSRLINTKVIERYNVGYKLLDIPDFCLFSRRLFNEPTKLNLTKDTLTYDWLNVFNGKGREFKDDFESANLRTRLRALGYLINFDGMCVKVKDFDTDKSVWNVKLPKLSYNERIKLYYEQCRIGFSESVIQRMSSTQLIHYLIATEGCVNININMGWLTKRLKYHTIMNRLNDMVLNKELTRNGNIYVEYKEEKKLNKSIYEIAEKIKQLKEKKNGKN